MLYLLSFSAALGNVKVFYVMSAVSQDAELGETLRGAIRLNVDRFSIIKYS